MSSWDKTATVKLESKEIWLDSPYDLRIVEAIREIPGRKWNSKASVWILPYTQYHAQRVIDDLTRFGFTIEPRIVRMAEKDKKVTVTYMMNRDNLFPFQSEAVDFVHKAQGRVILGDDMGLGKTIEALGWIRERPELKSILIVCPASVVYKWANEIKKWVGENEPVEVITTGSQPLPSVRFLIMSYAIMVAQHQNLIRQEWDVLVLDEAHKVKSQKAQRTRCAKSLQYTHCLLLTGTPVMNRPMELFSLLNMLNPVEWDNFFHYGQRYCAAKKTYFGWDFSGASNLNELRDRLKTYMIRRTKKEVLIQLPDLTRTRIPVEVKKFEIEEALKSLTQWVKENGHSNGGRAEAMVRLGKLRQAIGLAKVPIVLDMVEDILEQDESQKVVVYAVHHSVVQLLLEGLKKYGVSSITGETSQAERQLRIDNFQKRAMPRVMVISSAGGEGIDLYKADRVIFNERAWTSAEEEQVESRCHRFGQKNAVESIYLIASATVDRDMDALIESKRGLIMDVIGLDAVETIRATQDEFLSLVERRS